MRQDKEYYYDKSRDFSEIKHGVFYNPSVGHLEMYIDQLNKVLEEPEIDNEFSMFLINKCVLKYEGEVE